MPCDPDLASLIEEVASPAPFAPARGEAEWLAEALAFADATAEALVAEPPALAAAKAATIARDLAALVSTPVGSGDLLRAALRPSPLGEPLETAFRVTLPDAAEALTSFARECAALSRLSPPPAPLPDFARLMAESFTEAFGEDVTEEDASDASRPFVRFVQGVARIHAQRFRARSGIASPLSPDALTPSVIRAALSAPDLGYGWTGKDARPAI